LVKLEVFNNLGERTSLLINEIQSEGKHQFNFNAAGLSSGIYLARIRAGDFSKSIKMNLIK